MTGRFFVQRRYDCDEGPCHIEECEDPAESFGLCKKHYTRWKRWGDPYYVELVFDGSAPSHHPLATSYHHMVSRCTNPKDKSWHNYGGRGITICVRWLNDFWAFAGDMGERPAGLTPKGWPAFILDRIDNDGNYEPDNCRWVDRSESNRNRRRTGLHWSSKTHCPKNHPYDEANTYVSKKGSRHCRACTRERDLARKARLKIERKQARESRERVKI